jgi:hypothetical protein
MSGNTSATGGFLRQSNTPLSDVAFENVMHDAVVGILGIPPDLVRPRWQPKPPKQPDVNTNWVAIGITTRTPIDYPEIKHSAGGSSRQTRWSSVEMLASIYGPNAPGLAEELRDGFYVDQNRDLMASVGIKLTEAGIVTRVPDLFNIQWINRADLPVRFAQAVDRNYEILDIASSQGTISTDITGVDVSWFVNQ